MLRAKSEPGSMYSQSGITFYSKNYQNVNDSDMLIVSGYTGINYSFKNSWYTKANTSVTHIRLEKKSLVNYYGLSGKAGYKLNSSWVSLSLFTKYKDYFHSEDQHKEGYQFGQKVSYKVPASGKTDVTFDVENSDMKLKDKSYSYHSNSFGVSLTTRLRNDMELYLNSRYTKNKYDDVEKYYSTIRNDKVLRHRAGLTIRDVYKTIDAELSFSFSDRKSNNDIHTYKRAVLMLAFKSNLDD